MLDNYTPAALVEDARALKLAFPHVLVEASGVRGSREGWGQGRRVRLSSGTFASSNQAAQLRRDPPPARRPRTHPTPPTLRAAQGIRRDTIGAFFSPHVDVVSVGALTQGYATADFSLKLLRGAGLAAVAAVVAGAKT